MQHGAFTLGQMWNTYQDMENQFVNYLEYVPLTSDNKLVYSNKLLRLMLQLGGYVDTAFKEMAFCNDFDEVEGCLEIRKKADKNKLIGFDFYLKTFEPFYHLSRKAVVVKGQGNFSYRPVVIDRIIPFKIEPKKITPKWWQAYNGVKHDMIKNIRKANLENTLSGLGAAFLLNAVFEPSVISLLNEEVATAQFYSESKNQFNKCRVSRAIELITGKRPSKYKLSVRVNSQLFICIRSFEPQATS